MRYPSLSAILLLASTSLSLVIPDDVILPDNVGNNILNISAHLSQEDLEILLNKGPNTPLPASEEEIIRNSKRAITTTFRQYLVDFNGNNQGNLVNFYQRGFLYIFDTIPTPRTQNGNNAKDFVITVGTPAAGSFPGAIRYYSNAYLLSLIEGNGAFRQQPFDYSYISVKGRTYTIQPDSSLSSLNSYSQFNALGRWPESYEIKLGGMSFTLSADGRTISGLVDVIGWARNLFSTPKVRYRAVVTGVYQGSRKITF